MSASFVFISGFLLLRPNPVPILPLLLSARLHAHLIFGLARRTWVILHAGAALIGAYFATSRCCDRLSAEDSSATHKQHDSKTEDAHASIPFVTMTRLRHWTIQCRCWKQGLVGKACLFGPRAHLLDDSSVAQRFDRSLKGRLQLPLLDFLVRLFGDGKRNDRRRLRHTASRSRARNQ